MDYFPKNFLATADQNIFLFSLLLCDLSPHAPTLTFLCCLKRLRTLVLDKTPLPLQKLTYL